MPKVTEVKHARIPQNCGRCGKAINRGDPYRWASPGFRGPRLIRCMEHTCSFRQSELTTSNMSDAYLAVEDAEENLSGAETTEELKQALDDCADALDEVAQLYHDAMDAWTSDTKPEEWEEKADQLEEAASQLRDWEPDEPDEPEEGEDEEDRETYLAEFLDEQREDAETALADAQVW